MLYKSPDHSRILPTNLSHHKQSEEPLNRRVSELLQRRESHCYLKDIGKQGWSLLLPINIGPWMTGKGLFVRTKINRLGSDGGNGPGKHQRRDEVTDWEKVS